VWCPYLGSGHEEPDTSSNEGSDIEVEVTDGEYHENSAEEFMMSMTIKDSSHKEGDESSEIELDVEEADTGDAEYVTASVVFPMSKIATHENTNGVKMRKHKLKSSHKRRMRPQATPEEKECLATWVEVNRLKEWALWDSGSTTTGITPAFAEIAKVPVDTLEDPHIPQLGTIGSCSTIKYGADVEIKVADFDTTSYVDIGNFDRYDMIIGTPFMRKNKVILDFVSNKILLRGKDIPVVRVTARDLDPRLHRHRMTDKKQE